MRITGMNDKKAAKKIIKRSKKHPGWYTKQDVRYAKFVRKKIKQHEREVSERDSGGGETDGLRSESEQPKESRQSERSRIARLLHKARSLVRFRTVTHDSRDRND